MISFGTRLLWRRTTDYLQVYQPLLIGITGSTGSVLTQAALTIALQPHYRLRSTDPQYSTINKQTIACSILGIEHPRLSQSLVQELTEREPEVIPLVLTAEEPGLLDWVSQHIQCEVVVMMDVSTEHTDYFESRELIAHEQAALLATLPATGLAVLNQDEPLLADLKSTISARVITFGYDSQADIQLQRLHRLPNGSLVATVKTLGQLHELHFPHLLHGSQVMSVLAAMAVVHGLNLPLAASVASLQVLQPASHQLQRLIGAQQSTVLDDTAATTPESLINALEVLRAIPAQRRIAILGDLTDLGKNTYVIHKKIGKMAGEIAHIVIGVGELMRLANVEAILVGADTHHFNQSQDVGKWIGEYIQPGDVILVAGAPRMRMDQVVQALAAIPKE